MLILNRLRGTEGLWSKIIGLLLALVVQISFNNPYVSIAVGLGYIIGESFGWGEWVGTLSCNRTSIENNEEGKNNGIQWLARKLIPNYLDNFVNYCRVALIIRGFYWWLPTLAPLYFAGLNAIALAASVVVLAVGFPVACEVGYRLKDKIKFHRYGLSIEGGWEIQEAAYGVIQDIVLVVIIIVMIGV